MKISKRIKATVRIIDKLLRNDYESGQRALLSSARRRLIGLSRNRTVDRAELRQTVEEISKTILDAFYLDDDEVDSSSPRAIHSKILIYGLRQSA